jgi:hypothetical protein
MRLARQLKITLFFTLCQNNPNIVHEDGGPEIEQTLTHPAGILGLLVAKADAEKSRRMDALEKNYSQSVSSTEASRGATVSKAWQRTLL